MSEKKTLNAEEIVMERKLSRRSMTFVGGTIAGTIAALGLPGCCMGGGGVTGPATGCSDADPTDGAGRGTHCAGGAAPGVPAAVGCSDADPTDPAGAGRNCAGRRVCSDSDPTDPAGAGRSC